MVTSVAFSPDGKKVLTGSGDGTAKFWDVASGQAEKTFVGHTSYVYAVAFSHDGKKVLTGSFDKTAKLWDVASGQVEKTFLGHMDDVTSIAFSLDGKKVLTGSGDKTAKLWDVTSGQVEKTFVGHTSWVTSVAFSLDGKKVLTGSGDKAAKLWDAGAVEDKVYPFSLYDMATAGLLIEPEDTPQYKVDSTKAAIQLQQDRTRYEELMQVWEKSEERKQQDAAIEEAVKTKEAVDKLLNQIDISKDTTETYRLYGVLIDTLTIRRQKAPNSYASADLAQYYNSHAWYGFYLKKFEQSEADIRAGMQLDSTNKYLSTNLAPALLLQGGKYKAAQAEYEKWKDQPFGEQDLATYRDAFLDDLNTFEQAGIIPKEREKEVAAIRAMLEKKE